MNNIYITIGIIVITLLGIHIKKEMDQVENFANIVASLPKLINAIISFFTNFVDLFMVLVDAVINFAMSFVDLFLVLVEALQWIGKIPGWVFMLAMNIVNIFFDLLTIFVMWLNPITLVRSIIKIILFFIKMIFLMMADIVIQIFRIVSESLLNAFRGGMWGIPHEPHHHIKHSKRFGGVINKNDIGGFYHHHEHSGKGEKWDSDYLDSHKYRSLRCYRGLTADGYLNIIATIICPPLGVFMSFGLSGMLKILICAGLTLYYYVPGLVYAFLITSHLGLGMQLKVTDCGGGVGGLEVSGCEKRKTKGLCQDATLPDKRGKDGSLIPACKWEADLDDKTYGGTCVNTQFTDAHKGKSRSLKTTNYTDMASGQYQLEEHGGKNKQELIKKMKLL